MYVWVVYNRNITVITESAIIRAEPISHFFLFQGSLVTISFDGLGDEENYTCWYDHPDLHPAEHCANHECHVYAPDGELKLEILVFLN